MARTPVIILDLSGLLDEETLHEILYTKLELFPEYGFSFDALWDYITDNELSNMPHELRIEGLDDLQERLPSCHKKLVQCLTNYASEFPGRIVRFEGGSPSGLGLDVGEPIDDA